jgi:enterobacterial common antigen flippase
VAETVGELTSRVRTRLTKKFVGRHAAALAKPFGISASAFAAQLAMAAAGVVAARVLGPGGKGVTAAALAWGQTLGWALTCGLPAAAGVSVSESRVAVASELRAAVALAVGVVTPLTVILLVALPPVLGASGASTAVALLAVPMIVIGEVLFATNLAMHRTLIYAGGRFAGAIVLLTIVCTAASVHALTPNRFVAAWVCGQGVTLAVVGRKMPWRRARTATGHLRRELRFGIRAHLTNIMSLANLRLDVLIMSLFLAPTVVGYYSVANNVLLSLTVLAGSFAAVVTPEVAAAKHALPWRSLGRRHLLSYLAVACPVAVAMGVALPFALPVVFGSSFQPAVRFSLILLPGYVLRGIAGVVAAAAVGARVTRVGNVAEAAALVVTFVLLLALLPFFGALGAAIASTGAYATSAAVAVTLAFRGSTRSARHAAVAHVG